MIHGPCRLRVCRVWLVAVRRDRPSATRSSRPIWQVAGEGRGVPAVSRSNVYFLTKRHEVIAVDGTAGTVCWRRNTGEPGDETLGSSVIVSDDVVMAGDYAILAFDASTGMRRWRFDPTDGYGPGLYLGGAADGVAFAGSPSGRLYGVNDRGRDSRAGLGPAVRSSKDNGLSTNRRRRRRHRRVFDV